MSTGGSSTGSSRSTGPRRPPLGEFIDLGDGQRTPSPNLPTDDEPTVISSKPGSSGSMPVLTGHEWAEALVGQTLGHYELLDIVGSGGMGAVFRGHDTALAKTVAIKVLLPSSADDEDLLRRFKNEAQSAARLDHVHAARVYYVGEERGLHYIVYEYIEGRNIRDLVVEAGPLPIDEALRYAYQIADALSHAAKRDVVHRDIKPSNVLVTDEGVAKLVDMGLARLHQVEHSGGDLTASGVTLGTFDFISPEQARDPRRADVRSDIYSLGCTLYFMLTGQPPFPSGTVLQKLLQHEGDAPPDVRDLRADCPDELAEILRTMLAKKPEQRFQSPALLMSELAGFAARAGLGPLGASGTAVVAPSHRRRRSTSRHVPWVAALAVFAAAVALIHVLSRPQDTSSLFIPYPDAAEQAAPGASGDGSPANGNDDSASAAKATPVARADDSDAPPANSTGNDGVTSRSDRTNGGEKRPGSTENGAANANGSTAAEPTVAVGAPHPLRRVLDAAERAAAQSVRPADAAATTNGPSLAVSAGDSSDHPRIGPESDTDEPASDVETPGVVNVVVGAAADGETVYASLDAAIEASLARLRRGVAGSADTVPDDGKNHPDWLVRVELRFDGPLTCQPMRVARSNVDIFAGEGYSPTLLFQPASRGADDELPPAITVAEGELTLERVAIELRKPQRSSARVGMFAAEDADLIRLRDCSLTISSSASTFSAADRSRNSMDVFFDVAPAKVVADAQQGDETPEMSGAMPLLTVRLDRCVVRGDADLVEVGGARNARLTWSNGLAVLGGSLLAIDGSPQSLPGAHVRTILSHVTVALRGQLVSIENSQAAPYLPVVEAESYDSIYVGVDQPLVSSHGVDSAENLRDRFRWKGERNFYDNWTRFWRIHSVGSEGEPKEMDFRDWVSHWNRAESAPSLGPVIWRNPISLARAPQDQQLADFALADTDANPARGSGERGTNAGAALDQLPPLPWSEPPRESGSR